MDVAGEGIQGHVLVITEQTIDNEHIGMLGLGHGAVVRVFFWGQSQPGEVLEHLGHGFAVPRAAETGDLHLRQARQSAGDSGRVAGIANDANADHAFSSFSQNGQPNAVYPSSGMTLGCCAQS